MNVRFKGSDKILQAAVSVLAANLVQLQLGDQVVNVTGGFELMTRCDGGRVYGDYTDYTTIYRRLDDGSVILSCDGSVYVPPVYSATFVASTAALSGTAVQTPGTYECLKIPDVVPNENYEFVGWMPEIPESGELTHDITFTAQLKYMPTIEEVKKSKKSEISSECERIIKNGVDVEINGEFEHFSLTTNDQLNLFGKQAQIAAGAIQFEYHQDGHPCRYYGLEDMQKIINAAMSHVSYHTTYCNALNMWIAGAETKDEVNSIFYGANVPEKYQSEVLQNYVTAMLEAAAEVIDELA